MSRQPKALTQKHSEKFCENLRGESVQVFKEMAKILTLRERNSNNTECMAKLQALFSAYPDYARQINQYLQQSIRMPVQKTFTQKIEQLFSYVKNKNSENLNVIIDTLKKFDEQMRANGGIQTKQSQEKLKKKFLELFKDDEDLYNKAKQIFQSPQNRERPAPPPVRNRVQEDYVTPPPYNNNRTNRRDPVSRPGNARVTFDPPPPPRPAVVQPPRYPPDDMEYCLKLEKTWSAKKFANMAKVIFLFQHCIIGMNQALDLVFQDLFQNLTQYQIFKDMIQTRQGSRRRTSNPFKPLNDTDFSNSIRATFSYVEMPWCYPILCHGKTPQLKKILNDKWVSVPHGSQHSNFSIRAKNQFQQLLLKSEDERYEFDIYSYRLRKCEKLLDQIINNPGMSKQEGDQILHHVFGMNVIQTIYKNTTKDQKEDFEREAEINRTKTCMIFKSRIVNQSLALKTIRDVHAYKLWMQVAEKNFVKSLDRKCSEFKRNERQNTKPQFFEMEVDEKLRFLKKKQRPSLFQQNISPFSLLNSFESYSKIERCNSHQIKPDQLQNYNLEDYSPKQLLPILTLTFENNDVKFLVYSFFVFYVNNCVSNDSEKNKIKKTASKFFEKILGFAYVTLSLPQNFKQEQFFDALSKSGNEQQCLKVPVGPIPYAPGPKLYEDGKMIEQNHDRKHLSIKDQLEGQHGYLPLKTQNSSVWFFSFNMHVVLRLVYTIYQRLLKAFQILNNYETTGSLTTTFGHHKLIMFQILFMMHVKSKQNSKFEDHLGDLFGINSYLFSTIYKLFESLNKAIQVVSGDAFSSKLLDLITSEGSNSITANQTLYLLYCNRMTVSHNNSDTLFRVNYNHSNHLVTINAFKSLYKSWDDGKDKKLEQKLDQMQRNVEFYVTQPIIDHDVKGKNKKKQKKANGSDGNKMEYFCFSTGLKLYSRVQYEDYFTQPGRRQVYGNKVIKKQVKRAKKAQQFYQSSNNAIQEEV